MFEKPLNYDYNDITWLFKKIRTPGLEICPPLSFGIGRELFSGSWAHVPLKTIIPINSLFFLTFIADSDRIISCLYKEDDG